MFGLVIEVRLLENCNPLLPGNSNFSNSPPPRSLPDQAVKAFFPPWKEGRILWETNSSVR